MRTDSMMRRKCFAVYSSATSIRERNGLSGTASVLTSDVSKSFPISDAGFGAVSYMLETLMGFMGGVARWRTMPWMVTFFGILVIPLGATSIVLVMLQPISVGAWCAICLINAAAMLLMFPLTPDEVWAMAQFLLQKHHEGKPFWRTFFYGDADKDQKPENQERHEDPEFTAPLKESAPAMFWGMTLPWNLILSAGIGIWLMFAPDVFGTTGTFADSLHLTGALVVTWSVIVTAEVARRKIFKCLTRFVVNNRAVFYERRKRFLNYQRRRLRFARRRIVSAARRDSGSLRQMESVYFLTSRRFCLILSASIRENPRLKMLCFFLVQFPFPRLSSNNR